MEAVQNGLFERFEVKHQRHKASNSELLRIPTPVRINECHHWHRAANLVVRSGSDDNTTATSTLCCWMNSIAASTRATCTELSPTPLMMSATSVPNVPPTLGRRRFA
jgi:hypothetical protein